MVQIAQALREQAGRTQQHHERRRLQNHKQPSASTGRYASSCGSTPRSASIGSACAVTHAGATPNSMPVISETAKANASTGNEGVHVSAGSPLPAASMQDQPRSAIGNEQARDAAENGQHDALRERLPHQPAPRTRPAPPALMSACLRVVARTSIRLARLAQAISSTNGRDPHQQVQRIFDIVLHALHAAAARAQDAASASEPAPCRARSILLSGLCRNCRNSTCNRASICF